MTVQTELVELGTPDDLAREAALRFVELGRSIDRGSWLILCCTVGGSTPRAMYGRLAAPPLSGRLDWSRVHLFFSDERFVPPDSEESNYHTAKENLIDRVPIPAEHVHPYATVDLTPEAAAITLRAGDQERAGGT